MKHQPDVHKLFADTFLFVPTAGMRLVPEVLLLELFRELFYDEPCGIKEVQLSPTLEEGGKPLFTPEEQAIVYTLRGRRKATKSTKSSDFFAPAYPQLASYSWLRKESDRVVRDFLFRGALAQHFWGNGTASTHERDRMLRIIVHAVAGVCKSPIPPNTVPDMFYAALSEDRPPCDTNRALERAAKFVDDTKFVIPTGNYGEDPLAATVAQDLVAICCLEPEIPRMQWLHLLMTFMRFALPMYLLSQMRMTVMMRDWVIKALDGESPPAEADIMAAFLGRFDSLFQATSTPTKEAQLHVEKYMKARIELTLLLEDAEALGIIGVTGKKLTTTKSGSDKMSVESVLLSFSGDRHKFAAKLGDVRPRFYAIRRGEEWNAWNDPLHKGQGKNYDEFLRVLQKMDKGDEGGGHLLTPRRGSEKGSVVFPGSFLATLFALLADQHKMTSEGKHRAGKLLLGDVEQHFQRYGINFSAISGARARLIMLYQELGMLRGSPDAGEGVEVLNPYPRGGIGQQ